MTEDKTGTICYNMRQTRNVRKECDEMKKFTACVLLLAMVLSLTACGGTDLSQIKIPEWTSKKYTEEDVTSAMEVAVKFFDKEFSGCTMLSIAYPGDKKSAQLAGTTYDRKWDEVIVLLSSFDVDATGNNGSLNPSSTYHNYQWILGRKNSGKWKLLDNGY